MHQRNPIAVILLIALFGFTFVQLPLTIAARAADHEWYEPIVIIRRMLLDEFVEPLSEEMQKDMQESMLHSMVDAVDDPHTAYIPPRMIGDFDKEVRGTYVGIGAEIDIIDGWLTIVSPMDDSPALEAGIRAGDVVIEIEGESTRHITPEEAIETLTGDPGTQVTIRVRHEDGEEETITITRRRITTYTVKGVQRVGDDWDFYIDQEQNIAYIRVTQFTRSTIDNLAGALQNVAARGLNGLILDLRYNPGGELDGAVRMADLFLDDGVIVSVRGRDREREQKFRARDAGTFSGFPMIVMVNNGSASASEIVAGALKEHDRARVLGERTFGKGSVQEVRALPDNLGLLKLTTAYYYLPSGRHLHRRQDATEWGVDPSQGFHVSMTVEEYSDMLMERRRYDALANGDEGDDRAEAQWSDPEWIANELGDPQLAAALRAMNARLAGGAWGAPGEAGGALTEIDADLDAAIAARTRLMRDLRQANARIAELENRAENLGAERVLDDERIRNGTITVHDDQGNVIGTFRLTSEQLIQALEVSELEPVNTNSN